MPILRPLNKRAPEIPDSVMMEYAKTPKADLAEVCFSFAQRIFGEDLSAEELMQKIQQEREILKLYRQK